MNRYLIGCYGQAASGAKTRGAAATVVQCKVRDLAQVRALGYGVGGLDQLDATQRPSIAIAGNGLIQRCEKLWLQAHKNRSADFLGARVGETAPPVRRGGFSIGRSYGQRRFYCPLN